ncbi:MAG TPA: YybS family protein [Pseudogracilibacillus sp.]|nr:YybS family protein [Pseudogracilibacillus sp.]
MNNSKRVTDGALLMAIYIVLLLMSVFLPLFILIGLFILPIPFIIYAAKYNWKPTLLIIILSLVLSLMFATIVSLPLTILSSLGGLAIGTALYNKENSHQVWAKGTLGFIIGMMLVFIFAQFFLGINWEQELNTMIDESFTMTEEIMVQTGTDNQVNEQLTLIKEQMQNLTLLIPASMTIMSIFLSIVTIFISYKIMNRINKEKYKFIPFKDLNLPTSIFWLYFIAIILSFFNPDTSTTLGVIVINSVVILTTLMIIQGYSFVFFYANEKKWPKAIPIIIVIVSFLIPLIMMLVIRLLGIIDIGFGLKKRIGTQAK